MELSGFISWEHVHDPHWSNALGRDDVLKSIVDTLIVGVTAATLGVVISTFISYVVTRTVGGAHGAGPDGLGAMGRSRPRHGLGFLWAFVWLPIYGTLWVVVLALVARGLPVASRFFTATMVQLSAELEESARIHGGSWLRTFVASGCLCCSPPSSAPGSCFSSSPSAYWTSSCCWRDRGARMLSADIFMWTVTGRQEAASVLALIQTALVIVGYVIARLLLAVSAGTRSRSFK